MNDENKQLTFELKPEVAGGTYSNLAMITHSHSEFILDFAKVLPGLPKAEVVSRVIMTPEHCKRLCAALNDNIAKYESMFGRIELEPRVKEPQDGPKGTINIADFNPNGTKS